MTQSVAAPALDVRGLSGGYTRAPVLRAVNLNVHSGEIVAVFGANGAGKTTLLRGIDGSLPRASGEIRLSKKALERKRFGRAARVSTHRRMQLGIGHVPEGRHVFGALSVAENLRLGAVASRTARMSDASQEVYELFPRLADRRSQRAGSLSGGEQQMLVIGRALMGRPKVMLIDEMSAGLAPVMTERLVEGLVRIAASGVAVLLVEQAPQLVADAIDRAYLLSQGRIVGSGTLAELGGSERLAELYLGVS